MWFLNHTILTIVIVFKFCYNYHFLWQNTLSIFWMVFFGVTQNLLFWRENKGFKSQFVTCFSILSDWFINGKLASLLTQIFWCHKKMLAITGQCWSMVGLVPRQILFSSQDLLYCAICLVLCCYSISIYMLHNYVSCPVHSYILSWLPISYSSS